MYRVPPSQLYKVKDELAAFFFDRAVASFGSRIEREQQQATDGKSGKQAEMAANMVLVKWIPELVKGKFRTPTATR